jgi:hypothetical protein
MRKPWQPLNVLIAVEQALASRFDVPALTPFAPSRCRDQLPKRPVMQAHGITLPFHREMADSSRELVGPDVSAAVTLERYPRFIKGGFQDYEGLGIKRSTADSKHVPSVRSRLLGNNLFWSLPHKEVEFLKLPAIRPIIPN